MLTLLTLDLSEGDRVRFECSLERLADVIGPDFDVRGKRDLAVFCTDGNVAGIENVDYSEGIAGDLVARQSGYATVFVKVFRTDLDNKLEAIISQHVFVYAPGTVFAVGGWLGVEKIQKEAVAT